MNDHVTIERAQWKRFSAKGGRCLVCGNTGVISITLSARYLDGTTGGEQLAQEKLTFCDEHGQLRYSDARVKLHGGTVKG